MQRLANTNGSKSKVSGSDEPAGGKVLVDLDLLLPLTSARHVRVHDQVVVDVRQGEHLLPVLEGRGGRGGEQEGGGPGRRGILGEGGAGGASQASSQRSRGQPGQVVAAGHP